MICQQTGRSLSRCYDLLDLLQSLGNPCRLLELLNQVWSKVYSQYDTESNEIFHCSDKHSD